MNSWEKERAEQEVADRREEARVFKNYAQEQEALREYEARAGLAGPGPVDPPMHSLDDYSAWQGMAPSFEHLRQ